MWANTLNHYFTDEKAMHRLMTHLTKDGIVIIAHGKLSAKNFQSTT